MLWFQRETPIQTLADVDEMLKRLRLLLATYNIA